MKDLVCKVSIILPDGEVGSFDITVDNIYSKIAKGHINPAKIIGKMAASLRMPVKITAPEPKRTYNFEEPKDPPKKRGRPKKEPEAPAMATMSNMANK